METNDFCSLVQTFGESGVDIACDLLSLQVCPHCTLRFLGIQQNKLYGTFSFTASECLASLMLLKEASAQKSVELSSTPCICCLGSVMTETNGLAEEVVKQVRDAEHQGVAKFQIEVVPALASAVREAALRLHLEATHPSSVLPPPTSLQSVLEWTLAPHLEQALGWVAVPSGGSCSGDSVVVSVSMRHSEADKAAVGLRPVPAPTGVGAKRGRAAWKDQQGGGKGGGGGGRRGGKGRCFAFMKGACHHGARCKFTHHDDNAAQEEEHQPDEEGEAEQVPSLSEVGVKEGAASGQAEEGGRTDTPQEHRRRWSEVVNSLRGITPASLAPHSPVPPTQMSCGACEVQVWTQRAPVYIAGYYLKHARGLSQTPWLIGDEEHGDGSVESELNRVIGPHVLADKLKFIAAGREDMDVRMLGGGRPFVIEATNPHAGPPTPALCQQMEDQLSQSDCGVEARALTPCSAEVCLRLKEGEQDKRKMYTAVVWCSKTLSVEDIQKITHTKELVVQQSTPVRVLHRRSPLIRPRTIHAMSAHPVPGNSHVITLDLTTQAGTYIKEFVHGDFGRTNPSLCTILGCECDILQLDVKEVDMEFL